MDIKEWLFSIIGGIIFVFIFRSFIMKGVSQWKIAGIAFFITLGIIVIGTIIIAISKRK